MFHSDSQMNLKKYIYFSLGLTQNNKIQKNFPGKKSFHTLNNGPQKDFPIGFTYIFFPEMFFFFSIRLTQKIFFFLKKVFKKSPAKTFFNRFIRYILVFSRKKFHT